MPRPVANFVDDVIQLLERGTKQRSKLGPWTFDVMFYNDDFLNPAKYTKLKTDVWRGRELAGVPHVVVSIKGQCNPKNPWGVPPDWAGSGVQFKIAADGSKAYPWPPRSPASSAAKMVDQWLDFYMPDEKSTISHAVLVRQYEEARRQKQNQPEPAPAPANPVRPAPSAPAPVPIRPAPTPTPAPAPKPPEREREDVWSVAQMGKSHSYVTEVETFGSRADAEDAAREHGGYVMKGTQMWNEPLGQIEESDRPARYWLVKRRGSEILDDFIGQMRVILANPSVPREAKAIIRDAFEKLDELF